MITVFTPTYNRAYILGQAYSSLKKQTCKDFIWLIVDDGSSDNTEEIVKKWKMENTIKIEYIKQQNSGKHIAHNTAVMNCKTKYFLILDSDDYLDEKAIEIILKDAKKIESNDNIAGIIGNKFFINKNEKAIGKEMPIDIEYASGIELYQKYSIKGDTLRIYKTDILKQYLFPKIDGEKFIYENVVFDKIDAKHKMLINRDKLYYCEYLEDGYTANAGKVKEENPIGYALSLKSSAKYSVKKINKIKYTILYIMWCRRKEIKREKNEDFEDMTIYCFSYPIARIFEMIKFPKSFFR